jgi:putative addiction module component (TIGR02574 family)
MSTASLTEEMLALPIAERVALADKLYASVPSEWQMQADRAWLQEAQRRSHEMDSDPSTELSLDEFMAGLKVKPPET